MIQRLSHPGFSKSLPRVSFKGPARRRRVFCAGNGDAYIPDPEDFIRRQVRTYLNVLKDDVTNQAILKALRDLIYGVRINVKPREDLVELIHKTLLTKLIFQNRKRQNLSKDQVLRDDSEVLGEIAWGRMVARNLMIDLWGFTLMESVGRGIGLGNPEDEPPNLEAASYAADALLGLLEGWYFALITYVNLSDDLKKRLSPNFILDDNRAEELLGLADSLYAQLSRLRAEKPDDFRIEKIVLDFHRINRALYMGLGMNLSE